MHESAAEKKTVEAGEARQKKQLFAECTLMHIGDLTRNIFYKLQ